jgi:hypothetical protein
MAAPQRVAFFMELKPMSTTTALNLFIPITKVDVAQRLVYGLATAEVKHRPETAAQPSLRRLRKLACGAPPHHEEINQRRQIGVLRAQVDERPSPQPSRLSFKTR